jgi:hypothetical protein
VFFTRILTALLTELDSDGKNAFIAAGRSTEMPLILFWFWFQLPFQFP